MLRSPSRPIMLREAARIVLALALVTGAAPALAQNSNTEIRLNKVEAEVRALQRKVFPGGGDKYFAPEISATPSPSSGPPPSTSALTDVLTRMEALEAQLARLTGQVEQNTNRITQLEARMAFAGTSSAPAGGEIAPSAPAASQTNLAAMTGGASAAATPTPTPTPAPAASARPATPPSSSRIEAVSAVVKPSTGDAGEDEYSYGFRLWDAKFYPEAQQQLKLFLEKYPKHTRASWARNLLGRAYLDDGNALEAAKWFVQNYQADKNGARAPDSLLYLASAMKQLKDTKRACIALSEFSTTYASEAAGRLKSTYDSVRNGLNCSA
ncbi:tetratricopeptide repeat protein [Novosphingobium sp. M1R2S20]|uniref:Tol-pal system YbgF family protein n=1 Tax=Novosphingobium rhizovicinum TaxID=3228928 RepID=A0ABV3RA13_9SPHN